MSELLADIDEQIDSGKDVDVKFLDVLLLGNVTLRKHSATDSTCKKYDVVDGQQRLTTLSLLFAAANAFLNNKDIARRASRSRAVALKPPKSA